MRYSPVHSRVLSLSLFAMLVACGDADSSTMPDAAGAADADADSSGTDDTSAVDVQTEDGDDAGGDTLSPQDADSTEELDGNRADAEDADTAADVAAGDSADAAVDDATVRSCSPTLTVSVDRSDVSVWVWGNTVETIAPIPLTLSEPGCSGLVLTSDVAWLTATAEADALRVEVVPSLTPAGIHDVQVEVRLPGVESALATVRFEVRHLPTPGPEAEPRLLFIGIDGMRSDAFLAADTENLDRLMRHGVWTLDGNTQTDTNAVSAPGWATLYTGADPAKHRVLINADMGRRDWFYASFAWRLRHNFGFPGMMAAQWEPAATELHEPDAFIEVSTGNEAAVTAQLVASLTSDSFAVYMSQFDDVDHEGHTTGFSPANPLYIDEIEGVDAAVGELLDAVLARPNLANEDWLFVAVTDHGGEGTGHGPQNPANLRIPFIFTDTRDGAGEFLQPDVQQVDVAPTIFRHFGVDVPDDWLLDGRTRPVNASEIDPAGRPDDLELVCENRVDEDGDTLIDCLDPDCLTTSVCAEVCAEGDLGEVVGTRSAVGSNADAGNDFALQCARLPGDKEVSWAWTAPFAGTFTFSSRASDYDTILAAYDGACAIPSLALACNDDTGGLTSQVTVRAEAGQELAIVLAGFDGEIGEYALDISATTPENAVPSAGCGLAPAHARGGVQLTREFSASAGGERSWYMTIPTTYDAEVPHRVVFGYPGTGWLGTQIRPYLNLETVSANTIYVYPDPLWRNFPGWGTLGGWQLGPHAGPAVGMEDITFTAELLSFVADNYCVDTSRVFATGHSWGGDMAAVVGCFLGDRFAAVVPIAANRPYWFEPSGGGEPACVGEPAVWTFFGVADSHFTGQPFTGAYGVEQNAFWEERFGCSDEQRELGIAADGECTESLGCATTTRFCLYGAASGHQAPPYYAAEISRWFASF